MSTIWNILFITGILATFASADKECRALQFNHSSVVCVCDGQYCDHVTPEVPAHGDYLTVTSNEDGLRFAKEFGCIEDYVESVDDDSCGLDLNKQRLKLKIDRRKKYQEILGFGGAFTDAAGINMGYLSKDVQEQLLRSYFSEEGLNYNMGRVPIGGCDFSTRPYTYDDSDVPDPKLKKFSLQEEDYKYKIPYIKRAMSMATEEVLLTSAVWSPPLFMKTKNTFKGVSLLRKEYYRSYADYHIRFLEEYRKNGIEFWGISSGNEPSNGIYSNADFVNSLGWLPDDMADWIINYFGPAIRNSEFNSTKILFLDDSRQALNRFLLSMLKHEDVVQYMDAIALHSYFDLLVDPRLIDDIHKKYPELLFVNTELSEGSFDKERVQRGAWKRARSYTHKLIEELNHHTSSFIDWNFALDLEGRPVWTDNACDALILIDKDNNRFFKQPSYYAFGHFSKFMLRGSRRIEAKESTRSETEYVAVLRPDGLVALVLHNSHSHEVYATVEDRNAGTINIVLSAKSVTTLLY